MNIRKINRVFGYIFFAVGVLQLLLIVLVLTKLNSNLLTIYRGETLTDSNYYMGLATSIAVIKIVLAIVSIVMIIINTKNESSGTSGYVYGIGAILIGIIFSGTIGLVISSSLYMKAGSKLVNKNSEYETDYRGRI